MTICTKKDNYILECTRRTDILWNCLLSDGTTVWSDYERPGIPENPWNRLKDHCKEHELSIVSVSVKVIGQPETVVYEDDRGLDGFFIVRGYSKDLSMGTGEGTIYKHMTFGLLDPDDATHVDVKKFSFPDCKFEKEHDKRLLTYENAGYMIWRKGESNKENPKVQVFFDG